jgi:hypothetical protein
MPSKSPNGLKLNLIKAKEYLPSLGNLHGNNDQPTKLPISNLPLSKPKLRGKSNIGLKRLNLAERKIQSSSKNRIQIYDSTLNTTEIVSPLSNNNHHTQSGIQTQSSSQALVYEEKFILIKSLWNETGVTEAYRSVYENIACQLEPVYRNEYFDFEMNSLKKYKEKLVKLSNEIGAREKSLQLLNHFDKILSQDPEMQENNNYNNSNHLAKTINDIIKTFQHLRVLSINIVNHFIKMRKISSYGILSGKYDLDRINTQAVGLSNLPSNVDSLYHFDKNYLIKMKNDTDFLPKSSLKKYFNFASDSDPFLLALHNSSENVNYQNNGGAQIFTETAEFKSLPITVPIDDEMLSSIRNCQFIMLEELAFYEIGQMNNYSRVNEITISTAKSQQSQQNNISQNIYKRHVKNSISNEKIEKSLIHNNNSNLNIPGLKKHNELKPLDKGKYIKIKNENSVNPTATPLSRNIQTAGKNKNSAIYRDSTHSVQGKYNNEDISNINQNLNADIYKSVGTQNNKNTNDATQKKSSKILIEDSKRLMSGKSEKSLRVGLREKLNTSNINDKSLNDVNLNHSQNKNSDSKIKNIKVVNNYNYNYNYNSGGLNSLNPPVILLPDVEPKKEYKSEQMLPYSKHLTLGEVKNSARGENQIEEDIDTINLLKKMDMALIQSFSGKFIEEVKESQVDLPDNKIENNLIENNVIEIPTQEKPFIFDIEKLSFSFLSENLNEFKIVYEEYLSTICEDQKITFKLSADLLSYIKGNFPKIIKFMYNEKNSSTLSGMAVVYYDHQSENEIKILLPHFSTIYYENYYEIFKKFLEFLEVNYIFDELIVELYHGVKNDSYFLNDNIKGIVNKKLGFKWLTLENTGTERKTKYRYVKPKNKLELESLSDPRNILSLINVSSFSLCEKSDMLSAKREEKEINLFPLTCLLGEMIYNYDYEVKNKQFSSLNVEKLKKYSKNFIKVLGSSLNGVNEFIEENLSHLIQNKNSIIIPDDFTSEFLFASLMNISIRFENIISLKYNNYRFNRIESDIDVLKYSNQGEEKLYYLIRCANENYSIIVGEADEESIDKNIFSHFLEIYSVRKNNLN